MADVQAQPPAEGNQPPVPTPPGSEAAPTQDDGHRGDVTEALRQARERERQANARLAALENDPAYIYERAKALGMAEDAPAQPDPAPAPKPEPKAPPVQQPAPRSMKPEEVLALMDYRDVTAKNPELKDNQDLADMLEFYVTAKRMTYSQASEKVLGMSEESRARVQEAAEKAASDAAKANATAAVPGSSSTSETEEIQALLARMHQGSTSEREAALLEFLKRDNATQGIR